MRPRHHYRRVASAPHRGPSDSLAASFPILPKRSTFISRKFDQSQANVTPPPKSHFANIKVSYHPQCHTPLNQQHLYSGSSFGKKWCAGTIVARQSQLTRCNRVLGDVLCLVAVKLQERHRIKDDGFHATAFFPSEFLLIVV